MQSATTWYHKNDDHTVADCIPRIALLGKKYKTILSLSLTKAYKYTNIYS